MKKIKVINKSKTQYISVNMILSTLPMFSIKRRAHIYIKLKHCWGQFFQERPWVKQNITNIIIDCYMIIICPKSTLVHSQRDSLTYPIYSSCATLCATHSPYFVLHRFSPEAGKGKIVTEITKPAPYLSGSFGENRGFSNREDSWKKRKKV